MPLGSLPRLDTELVILRVAWQCGSAYEWHQHVRIAHGEVPAAIAAACVWLICMGLLIADRPRRRQWAQGSIIAGPVLCAALKAGHLPSGLRR